MRTELFIIFCSGVGALASIIGAVVYTIRREIEPVKIRIAHLERSREEEVQQRITFEGKLLGKLDEIKDSIRTIREQYVSEEDLDKQQKLCPARIKAMEDIKNKR